MSAESAVRVFYAAMSSGDTSAAEEVLAPDWEDIPVAPGASPGPEGFRQTVAFLRGVFPDLDMTVEDIVVSDDRVAVRSVARATHGGEFLGVPPTGKKVEFRAFDFHRVDGGRIVQSFHLEDNFDLLQQLGVTFTPQP